MRDPLLAPMAAIASGVLLFRLAKFDNGELLTAIAASAVLCLVSMRFASAPYARAACLLAFVFAGAFLARSTRPATRPIIEVDSHTPAVLEGCVVESPVNDVGRQRFVLELEPGARARVNVYFDESEKPPSVVYGDRVEVDGFIRLPRNFGNPGAFDYAGYLEYRQIFWTVSARTAGAVRKLGAGCGTPFQAWLSGVRQSALRRIETLYGTPFRSAMFKALLLGDDTGLQQTWVDEFRQTGTYHALVISGAHVAAVSVMLFLLLAWLPWNLRAVVVLAIVWLYAMLSGASPPVVRSAAGLTFYVFAKFFYREARTLNLLAAIALLFLLISPGTLYDASFQLTFTAVLLLGAIAAPLNERLTGWRSRALSRLMDNYWEPAMPRHVVSFRIDMRLLAKLISAWTPLAAMHAAMLVTGTGRFLLGAWSVAIVSGVMQLGFALPMALYFHRVSLTGLAANVLVVPATAIAVPAGLIALLTGWALPAWISALALDFAIACVRFAADLEPAWRVPDPPLWLAIAAALSLIAIAASVRYRLAAIAMSSLLLAAILLHPFAPRVTPGVLELTAIDVGQGESLLVSFPNGRLMLVDAGGIPQFRRNATSRLDMGEDVVSPYLWHRRIKRLDVVALTHSDEDHIGGLPAILRNFEVGELWTGKIPTGDTWAAVEREAARFGVPVRFPSQGQTRSIGGAAIEILWPVEGSPIDLRRNNNNSLVMRIRHGAHQFLLAGDIEKTSEEALLAAGTDLKAGVLKLAHHGSKSSTSDLWINAVKPAIGLVSAGYDNLYGHPHHDVTQRLRRAGIALLRTDQFGLLIVRSDGRRLQMDTNAWQPSDWSLNRFWWSD